MFYHLNSQCLSSAVYVQCLLGAKIVLLFTATERCSHQAVSTGEGLPHSSIALCREDPRHCDNHSCTYTQREWKRGKKVHVCEREEGKTLTL